MEPDAVPGGTSAVALERLVNDLARTAHDLLQRTDRPQLAERLEAERERYEANASLVVVAGAGASGKSRLINALLDAPGLLPVAVGGATAAPISLVWGPEPQATAERLDPSQHVPVELSELASVEARRVHLQLPSPLLEGGLVLLDTPGIGSLRSGDDDFTLGLLTVAHALVFVTSADAPLRRSDADFLARAAQCVDQIELVVTKCDLIGDAGAFSERLRSRARELGVTVESAPLLTSAELAERSAAANGERAIRLRSASGLDALHAVLRARLRDPMGVRLASLAHTTAVAAALALADPEIAAMPSRESLSALLTRADANARRRLAGILTDLEREYRERVESAKDVSALVRELPSDLEASLKGAWIALIAGLDAELRADAPGLADRVPEGRELPERVREASGGRELVKARPQVDALDHALPGVTIGAAIGHLSFAVLGPVGWALGAATGVGAIAARSLRKAKAHTKQQASAAVADAFREARRELGEELKLAVRDRRTALERALKAPPDGMSPDTARKLRDVVRQAETLRQSSTPAST